MFPRFLSIPLVVVSLSALGCGSSESEASAVAAESPLTSMGDRVITTYGIAHGGGVEGIIPSDGNLTATSGGSYVESATSKPVTTYFSRVQAGTKLRISNTMDGIYKLGDPPPGWTGECYESCLPWIPLTKFDRAFLGYKLAGRVTEVELSDARELTLDIPETASGTMEYWFRFEDAQRRSFWDSRRGQNYKLAIVPSATAILHFGPSGEPTVTGTLKRGGAFRVEYTLDRFTSFDLGGGAKAKNVSRLEVAVTFDGLRTYEWMPLLAEAKSGAAVDVPKLVKNGWTYYENEVLVSPVFVIPESADGFHVWAVGAAINLDVWPVERPFLLDGKGGITKPSGPVQPVQTFEFTL
jgi:hypothetical protein